jgi:ribosome maturation factor RimP
VRTRAEFCPEGAKPERAGEAEQPRAGRRGASGSGKSHSITGELLDASESEVTLAVREGVIAIPYTEIRRSNLVES